MTGEPIAKVSQANGGLLERDMRKAQQARDAPAQIPCDELIERVKKAGELYLNATLPLGDGQQSPDEFARQQSATTGLPDAHVPRPTCRRISSCSRTWTKCSTR